MIDETAQERYGTPPQKRGGGMRRGLLVGVLVVLMLVGTGCVPPPPTVVACEVEAFFTAPGRNRVIEARIVEALNLAHGSLLVAMYSFTDDQLGDAVVAAWTRGVKVWVILDTGQVNAIGGEYAKLVTAGIPVAVESVSGLMHNKFAVFDSTRVVTGSYNWSDAADTANFENTVFIDCPEIAAAYSAEFWRISASLGTGWTPTAATLSASVQPAPASCAYIGNKASKIFHAATCGSVKQMSDANKVCLASIADALAQGYRPCGTCKPCGADGVCP